MEQVHEKIVNLNKIGTQVNDLTEKLEDFESFKNEALTLLKSLLSQHNEIKQELFVIRNTQQHSKSHYTSMDHVQSQVNHSPVSHTETQSIPEQQTRRAPSPSPRSAYPPRSQPIQNISRHSPYSSSEGSSRSSKNAGRSYSPEDHNNCEQAQYQWRRRAKAAFAPSNMNRTKNTPPPRSTYPPRAVHFSNSSWQPPYTSSEGSWRSSKNAGRKYSPEDHKNCEQAKYQWRSRANAAFASSNINRTKNTQHSPVYLKRGSINDFFYSRNIFDTFNFANDSGN